MFNITNTKTDNGVVPNSTKLRFADNSSIYWDGDSAHTYLVPVRYMFLDTNTAMGRDLATMPILRMGDGTWHELNSVLFEPRMEPAGISEPSTRFDDQYTFTQSLAALEELSQVANQIEATALVKSRGPTAFAPPEPFARLELSSFLFGIDTTVYQEWLKGYVQRNHAEKYDEIFNAPFSTYMDARLFSADGNSAGMCDFNLLAARTGVSLISIGDGVYQSNRMEPVSLCPYIKNPMRAFGKLPAIRITDWEHETFNGTDID